MSGTDRTTIPATAASRPNISNRRIIAMPSLCSFACARLGVSALAKALVRERGRRLEVLGEARGMAGDQLRRRSPPALPNR